MDFRFSQKRQVIFEADGEAAHTRSISMYERNHNFGSISLSQVADGQEEACPVAVVVPTSRELTIWLSNRNSGSE
jgi:hypothetical protein